MIPYPTTDLDPSQALRALRANGFRKVTRQQMLGGPTWASLVAIWASKRNAQSRGDGDVEAWARLVNALNEPRSFRVDTKKLTPPVAHRLAQFYKHVGVGPSQEQVRRGVQTKAAANAVDRIVHSARRVSHQRVDFCAYPLLGELLADSSAGYIVIGHEGQTGAFERSKLRKVAAALKHMGPVTAFLDTAKQFPVLSLRWREGRGGLNLLPATVSDQEVREAGSVAVVFPHVLPPAVVVEVTPPTVSADDATRAAVKRGLDNIKAAPVIVVAKPVKKATVAAPVPPPPANASRTSQAWSEFKIVRPQVEELEARIRAGTIDAPNALALIEEGRNFKRTSWGSTLRVWKKALATVEVAA